MFRMRSDCAGRRRTGRAGRRAALPLAVVAVLSIRCSGPGPLPGMLPSAGPGAKPRAASTPLPDLFATGVRPIMSVRCSPCHEPGGRMYARLPFDRAAVVASHAAGISRRLRDPERAALAAWLATAPPSAGGR